jgi:hypothetical protein
MGSSRLSSIAIPLGHSPTHVYEAKLVDEIGVEGRVAGFVCTVVVKWVYSRSKSPEKTSVDACTLECGVTGVLART